jgi:phytoene dehydrogenase-like protein
MMYHERSFRYAGLPLNSASTVSVTLIFLPLFSTLDYVVGGSDTLIQGLVRGLEKHGGELRVRKHVEELLVDAGRCVGVRLANGAELRAKRCVISNASVWDTLGLIPRGVLPSGFRESALKFPALDSFLHLHLGIDATGLDARPEHHDWHTTVFLRSWDDIGGPLNCAICTIPSIQDKTLARAGKWVIHIYYAGNEPYSVWEPFKDRRLSKEYRDLKRQRADGLYAYLERIIPDIRGRVEVEKIGTPLTAERFLNRHRGSYGGGLPASAGVWPGPRRFPIDGLFHCGDSCNPGVGVPAAVMSGVIAANTILPVEKQKLFLRDLQTLGYRWGTDAPAAAYMVLAVVLAGLSRLCYSLLS